MIKMTDEMKDRVNNAYEEKKYCIWPTQSDDGYPDMSYGRASIYKSGEMREKIMNRTCQPELDKDPERKGYGILVRIDKIRGYSGYKVLQER